MKHLIGQFFLGGLLTMATVAYTEESAESNPASDITKESNKRVLTDKIFNWEQHDDIEFAQKGFICPLCNTTVKDATGHIVWSNVPYDQLFKRDNAPESINPSLWRHEKLSAAHGLYKVTDGVYQIRGQDLSNITCIVAPQGYIIIDPLASREVAANAMALFKSKLPDKPVIAVIYSHSHIDHFAGVKGVVNEKDVKAGKVRIFAPAGFTKYAIEENVMAGNAMSRRALYMYGTALPVNEHGQIGAGEGKIVSKGERTLILPTDEISEMGKKVNVGGIDLQFDFAPGEAPVGMHVYIPSRKSLYLADNCVHGIPNVYTIRGALTRNPITWKNSIDSALKYKDAETCMAGHNWPRFGKEKVREYLTNQSDALKYMHDQTLRLLNYGYTGRQIEDMIKLPADLANKWYLRNYYGDIRHNVRGIYTLYMGWYNADPATLHPLPPRQEARKYVEYMGGAKALLEKAGNDYNKGEYRWVAKVTDILLWAEPDNTEAKILAAKAQEQLGYQAECAVWRNAYLTGAMELRQGVKKVGHTSASKDIVAAMTIPMLFDFLAMRLNPEKAAGKSIVINWSFPDTKEKFMIAIENSVLKYTPEKADKADTEVTVNHADMPKLLAGGNSLAGLQKNDKIKITGDADKLKEFFSMLDEFPTDFPIVTHEKIKIK
jgi:alkyl sulfatase BDS1-like metallo-beta-lactamase superfamily hydrolase